MSQCFNVLMQKIKDNLMKDFQMQIIDIQILVSQIR